MVQQRKSRNMRSQKFCSEQLLKSIFSLCTFACMLHNELLRNRQRMRNVDIAESRQLLWEMIAYESTVQQCVNIVEAACLASGVQCLLDGVPCGYDFQSFVTLHYGAFCRRAIRAFFCYGFVPWFVRRDELGNGIPDILPDGSFHWETVPSPSPEGGVIREPIVRYRVQLVHSLGIQDKDIFVYSYVTPSLGVASGSFLNATVASPMSQLLVEYKELRQAQIRRSYADAWNTTAKLICTYSPKTHAQDDPSATLMDFADDTLYSMSASLGIPFIPRLSASNLDTRDAQLRKQLQDVNTHVPDVFTLPRDHGIAPQVILKGREDIPFLWEKFQRGVAAITHVPYDMIASTTQTTVDHRKTMSAGKIFSNNMLQICVHLETLCKNAYQKIYGNKDNVRFFIRPFSRLEVESIDELKTLYEIGVLTTEHQLDISSVLLPTILKNANRDDPMKMDKNAAQKPRSI